MALVVVGSSSTALVVGTSANILNSTTGKTYVLNLDLTPIVGSTAPDVLEVYIYNRILSSTTAGLVLAYTATYQGGLIVTPSVFSVPVPAAYRAEFWIEQVTGTGRTIDWSVLSID